MDTVGHNDIQSLVKANPYYMGTGSIRLNQSKTSLVKWLRTNSKFKSQDTPEMDMTMSSGEYDDYVDECDKVREYNHALLKYTTYLNRLGIQTWTYTGGDFRYSADSELLRWASTN